MARQPTLVEWLQRKLKEREWNQSDFARHLGVGTGTVTRWLQGTRPDTEYIDRIAELFHADTDYVLTLAGHRPPDPQYAKDDPRNHIISQLGKISDEQAMVLLDMIESMQKRLSRILASEKVVHGGP